MKRLAPRTPWHRPAAMLLAAGLCIATQGVAAQTPYTNMLRPGVGYATMAQAQYDFMAHQIMQRNQARIQAVAAPAPVATAAAAAPLTASDFRPAGPRDTAQQLARAIANPADQASFLKACREIQATIEATPGFRKNNLAAAFALLIGASLQAVSGQEIDDARSDALLRIVNDDLVESGALARLSPGQRTRAYDGMLLIGGLIAGLSADAAQTGNAEMAAQARRMAQDALSAFGLAAGASAPAAAGPGWGLWQYTPPPGQATERVELRAWQLVQGRSFCQFALYAAMPGSGDARSDFAAEWAQLSQARGVPSAAPAAQATTAPHGWMRLDAARDEQSPGVGRYRVRQVSFSGHGQRMSALVSGNDAALCEARGEAFLASLVPQRPQAGAVAIAASPAPVPVPSPAPAAHSGTLPPTSPAANANDPNRAPDLSAQAWMKTAASYSHWGSNFTVGELAKLSAGQGYARRSWQFGADGRYRYRVEIWSMTYKPKELSGIEETGRWRMQGDRVIVEPERSVSYAEDKESRRRFYEKPAKTERTEYAGRLHWLSGMGAWYLVLAPVDGRKTEREGDFDNQPGFPNAYFYGPPPKVGG